MLLVVNISSESTIKKKKGQKLKFFTFIRIKHLFNSFKKHLFNPLPYHV